VLQFHRRPLMDPYARETEHCLLEGATPEQVDGALEQFGIAMGIWRCSTWPAWTSAT
jgi:hypothetical protein